MALGVGGSRLGSPPSSQRQLADGAGEMGPACCPCASKGALLCLVEESIECEGLKSRLPVSWGRPLFVGED